MNLPSLRLLLGIACIFTPLVCSADQPSSELAYKAELNLDFHQVDDITLKADVYQPNKLDDSCPVVLIVHGGGWRMGDKWMPATYARMFAEHGIAAVSINYRLAPKHKFPAQLDDVRAGLAWIAENAEKRRWDTSRLGMFGYSAGAHLCSMIGTLVDEPQSVVCKTTQLAENDPIWKKLPQPIAIVAGGTPAEFRTISEDSSMLSYFLGGTRRELPEIYRYASPAALASAGDVPTLFYHGATDWIVPIASAQSLFKAQCAAGVDSQFITIEGQGHLLSFTHDSIRPQVLKFLQRELTQDGLPKRSDPGN